ncbi:MAG: hypothetical protein ACKVIR_08505, partial [Candidatus Poseidoniales archaeon]
TSGEYPTYTNLTNGTYCIAAQLYKSNWTLLDSTENCVTVSINETGPSSNEEITIDYLFDSGYQAYALHPIIEFFNLSVGVDYSVNLTMQKSLNSSESTSFSLNWTANNTSALKYPSFYNLTTGRHCLTAILYYSANGTEASRESMCDWGIVIGYESVTIDGLNSTYTTGTTEINSIIVNLTYLKPSLSFYEFSYELTKESTIVTSDSYRIYHSFYVVWEYLDFENLSAGTYCLTADLTSPMTSNNTSNTISVNKCFTIDLATSSSGSEEVEVFQNSTSSTSYLNPTISSWNLSSGTEYTLLWTFNSSTTTLDSQMRNWTANASTSGEYPTYTNLTNGTYCIAAQLYKSNWTLLDSTETCVTVSVLGPESITIGGINGTYVNGTTSITGYFLLDQLKSTNYYYAISFQLLRENISVYSDHQIMYTFNVSDHLIYSLYNLTEGYYCLNAQLTNDMGTFSKYDTFCFTIEATFVEEVATGTIEIDNTDTEFYVGDTIETDLTLVGLNSNIDYLVEWNWWSSETSSINGNESIESSSGETLSLAPFDSGNAGSYCVNATLSSDSVSIDTDSWCYNLIEEPVTNEENDEDGDGVPDEWDECPGSTGKFTDSDGCEPDTEEAVEKAEESGLPGFTAALGLMALIGAAIIARRD